MSSICPGAGGFCQKRLGNRIDLEHNFAMSFVPWHLQTLLLASLLYFFLFTFFLLSYLRSFAPSIPFPRPQ
jgi:hypothetical protein